MSPVAPPSVRAALAELDCFDAQILSQRRLVLPNLADHRLSCIPFEEELDDRALTTP